MKSKFSGDEVLDPVAAYDCIAPVFHDVRMCRKAYLEKIEELVIARVPKGEHFFLDVGAGDGRRSLRIAREIEARDVVLLEPSVKMREGLRASCEIWPLRAEELNAIAPERKFSVIACLWNVLGHVPTAKREDALKQCARMLSPGGLFFVDVNHRYNMRAYGFWRTVGRMAYDRVLPGTNHGDVIVHWDIGKTQCDTYGHVFTQGEMQTLISKAGLEVKEKIYVDYGSGEIRSSGFEGNLFYLLRRAT